MPPQAASVSRVILTFATLACATEPSGRPAMVVLAKAPSGWAENLLPIPAPVAQLADVDGNLVAQAGREITVAITAGEGVIVGVATVPTDTLGAATFDGLALTGPLGEKTLTFSSPGLLSASTSVNLTAGPAIPAESDFGCFLDDQGRIYCLDPNPVVE
jgi:hypothetical protein